MARRSSNNTISLFPFLAVLVCTMGALILLLLVTTRRIRNEQTWSPEVTAADSEPEALGLTSDLFPLWQEATVQDFVILAPQGGTSHQFSISLLPPAEAETAKAKLAEKRRRIQMLQQQASAETRQHQELQARIVAANEQLRDSSFGSGDYHDQLSELARLKQQETQLNDELAQQHSILAQLQTELESQSKLTEDGEEVLRQRESALISLRKIADGKSEALAAGTDQTVIDFTNTEGTQRTPIIIDVTVRGFEFLPTGVKVSTDDMNGFPANDNPLLSGIIAIHDSRNPNSVTTKPYVLLLVRPDGSMEFYAAQRTLANAGIHFGYELVEQDQIIADGIPREREKTAIQQALLSALRRRRELYGGMMAKIDALHVKEQSERRATVLPDGRVSVNGDGEEFDGRFYAGGAAPPKKSEPFARWNASDGPGNQEQQNPRTNSSRLPNETVTSVFPEQPNFDSGDEAPVAELPLIVPGVQSGSDELTAVEEFSGSIGGPDFDSVSAYDLFPQRSVLSGNMGIGGGQRSGGTNGNSLGRQATDTETSSGNNFGNSAIEQTDRLSSQQRFGRPDTGTAPRDHGTRTAEAAEYSQVPASTNSFGSAGATGDGNISVFGGASDGAAVSQLPTSDSQTFLQQFMQKVEQEKSTPKPNSFLLALQQQAESRNLPPDEATNPFALFNETDRNDEREIATPNVTPSMPAAPPATPRQTTPPPVAAQPVAPQQQRRINAKDPRSHNMVIVLTKNQLTLGDFEPIDTTGWDAGDTLAMVLEGLNAELELLAEAGRDDVMPTVSFVVGPEMLGLQKMLTTELSKQDVVTTDVSALNSNSSPEAPKREPAEPQDIPRLPKAGLGLSI